MGVCATDCDLPITSMRIFPDTISRIQGQGIWHCASLEPLIQIFFSTTIREKEKKLKFPDAPVDNDTDRCGRGVRPVELLSVL